MEPASVSRDRVCEWPCVGSLDVESWASCERHLLSKPSGNQGPQPGLWLPGSLSPGRWGLGQDGTV